MTDTTSRLVDAEAARVAWERFTGPAIKALREHWAQEHLSAAADVPNIGNKDRAAHAAVMIRAVDELCGKLASAIFAGDTAQAEAARASVLDKMDPEQRRWATY